VVRQTAALGKRSPVENAEPSRPLRETPAADRQNLYRSLHNIPPICNANGTLIGLGSTHESKAEERREMYSSRVLKMEERLAM
jgi:hypothetical protein